MFEGVFGAVWRPRPLFPNPKVCILPVTLFLTGRKREAETFSEQEGVLAIYSPA